MPLINCEANLTSSANCVIWEADTVTMFAITDKKLYV